MPLTKRRSSFAAALPAWLVLLPAVLFVPFLPAAASQVRDSKPVRIHSKTPKPATDSWSGEVVSFTPSSVTVRDRANMSILRTFSFSPELARKVENRHMEHGDRVSVRYLRGTETAVALKGRLRRANLPLVR